MPACVRSVERFLPFETARSSLRSSATQGTTTSLLPRVPACTRFSRNDGLSEQANDNAGDQASTMSRSDETRAPRPTHVGGPGAQAEVGEGAGIDFRRRGGRLPPNKPSAAPSKTQREDEIRPHR